VATFKHVARKPLDSSVTLVVDIEAVCTREYHIRFWLSKQLIRMAAWVMGCNVRFGDESEAA
jgi:hypothetical protein